MSKRKEAPTKDENKQKKQKTLEVNSLHQSSMDKFLARDFQGAIEDCTTLISLLPNDKKYIPYGNRAMVYQALGEYVKAIEDCNFAINNSPHPNSKWHYIRAKAQFELQHYEDAIKDLTLIIATPTAAANNDFQRYKALSYRHRAYCHLKQFDKAIADCTILINETPDTEWKKELLADTYRDRGRYYFMQKNYDASLNDYNHAEEHYKQNANKKTLYLYRGMTHLYREEPDSYDLAHQDFIRADAPSQHKYYARSKLSYPSEDSIQAMHQVIINDGTDPNWKAGHLIELPISLAKRCEHVFLEHHTTINQSLLDNGAGKTTGEIEWIDWALKHSGISRNTITAIRKIKGEPTNTPDIYNTVGTLLKDRGRKNTSKHVQPGM